MLSLLPLVACSCLVSSHSAAAEKKETIHFQQDIQPILEQNCIRCHGENKQKGSLRLDTRELMLEGGDNDAAIHLEKPAKSPLITLVSLAHDHDDLMPPQGKNGGDPLDQKQIAKLLAWVEQGAPWPEGIQLKEKEKSRRESNLDQPDPNLESIEVFPKKVSLETKEDFHRLIAIAHYKDATTRDITPSIDLKLTGKPIARIDGTTLYPLADGSATLEVNYRGQSQKIPVTVKGAETPRPVSFQRDVMPVLTAAGCNTGSCHGSARGQDGFHLSLFGYDPKGDHHRLTREMPGRRVNLAIPNDSLLLTKSVASVPHTGGKRFDDQSAAYRVLLNWLKDGAGYDAKDPVLPVRIEVRPNEAVLKGSGEKLPLTVRAIYSDGTDRDVTTLTTFTTSNDNSVQIEETTGLMTSAKRGEAFLLGRFHTFTEGMQTIVLPEKTDYKEPKLPTQNYIDTLVDEKLRKLRVVPSELCDDATFIRRVYLDLVGQLPSTDERKQFLASTSPTKRAALIDQLIETKEFTEIWVMKWSELLQIRTFNNQVSYKAALLYHSWLRERMLADMPFNQLVYELLSARGGTFANPATNYYQVERDTKKLSENVAQVFMGTRIQCAQCHNHMFDRWTMDDYYSFTAFFTQIKRKKAEDPREQIIYDGGGEIQHPVTKKNALPQFLGGGAPTEEQIKNKSRREVVAAWLTAPENPWFARNVSNIVWAHFFGVGIVEPVDDVRVSNPPSNPALLDALAEKFVASDFQIKNLVRDICNSRTYQLSSRTNPSNAEDQRNFSHAQVRRMRAEILLDVISQVTKTPNKFKGLPKGSRAIQIADGNTSTYFLKTFGRSSRQTVASTEVKMDPSLSQSLHLLNGETTHQRIQQGKLIPTMLQNKKSPSEIIEYLYLRCLGRKPTREENQKLMLHIDGLTEQKAKIETLEDIFWALLNSKEFIFNH